MQISRKLHRTLAKRKCTVECSVSKGTSGHLEHVIVQKKAIPFHLTMEHTVFPTSNHEVRRSNGSSVWMMKTLKG